MSISKAAAINDPAVGHLRLKVAQDNEELWLKWIGSIKNSYKLIQAILKSAKFVS